MNKLIPTDAATALGSVILRSRSESQERDAATSAQHDLIVADAAIPNGAQHDERSAVGADLSANNSQASLATVGADSSANNSQALLASKLLRGKLLQACVGLLLTFSTPAMAAGLTPLGDTQLASITGREGVAMDFDYGLNAFKEDTTIGGTDYKRGDPLPRALLEDNSSLLDPTATTTGWNGCARISATDPNACSMAISTNNRPGMWLTLKDMWAVLKMHNFWIDGGRVTESGGTYTLTLPGSKTYTSPFTLSNANADETRFYDASGNCLLAGKTNGNCNMAGLPLLVMQYDPLNAANSKADVTWHLHIGRVAIQGDNGSTAPAYMRDDVGSFMTYVVTDFNQNEAKIHYGGRVLMFGF